MMYDCAHTWRKKLLLQVLVTIARKELEFGKDVSQVCKILDEQMNLCWRYQKTIP